MAILVTGGAGYIGSHMALALLDRGEDVVVVDDLSTGVSSLVPQGSKFIQADVGDQPRMVHILKEQRVDAVVHFAGSVVVPDSVANPLAYYKNNTCVSRSLIEACVQTGVNRFLFSSTAAVYGTPSKNPVRENDAKAPINPYGRSKLITEWMLEDTARSSDLAYVALRYFNVAGADPRGRAGQSTPGATHLIKRACQAALGRIPHLDIYGTDYPTPDGTGVRDYIHVWDLIGAHLAALDALAATRDSGIYNVGYGHGFSVRDIVKVVEKETGRRVPVREAPRRPGDPASLIADSTQLRSTLNWQPRHDDLAEIVHSAFRWESRLNS